MFFGTWLSWKQTICAHGRASVPTKLPGHNVTSDIKTGNEIHDYSQPVIDQKNLDNKISMIYLMLTSLALDTSQREILYRTF